jgi:hypothetical protein
MKIWNQFRGEEKAALGEIFGRSSTGLSAQMQRIGGDNETVAGRGSSEDLRKSTI